MRRNRHRLHVAGDRPQKSVGVDVVQFAERLMNRGLRFAVDGAERKVEIGYAGRVELSRLGWFGVGVGVGVTPFGGPPFIGVPLR